MKLINKTIYTIILISVAFSLNGCGGEKKKDKETIFVSIQPQKFFLDNLVKDNFSIKTIIPEGSNPEIYDPTPSQMLEVGKCNLYFKIGFFGFENSWLQNLQKNNPNLYIVNSSESIEPIEIDHVCSDHDHNHTHQGEDPHVWSSPATAKVMVQNMYKVIIEKDSLNKDFYDDNYNALMQIFNNTDSIIKAYLQNAPSKSFIIYHPSLSYYANEYGLNQLSIEQDGKQPTPSNLKTLIDLAKQENVKVVFIQEEFDKKNAETVAKEIGAKIVPLNLLAYDWDKEMIKIAKSLALEE